MVYVACSVTDLDEAIAFFSGVVGLERAELELHVAEHEQLWGLPDARRRAAVLHGGRVFLELVQYEVPAGRPRSLEDTLDCQGFKTVAGGCRDPAESGGVFRRVREAGLDWTVREPASFIEGNHVVGAVAHHLKSLSVPLEVERQFCFSPEPPKWWRPPLQAAENQA